MCGARQLRPPGDTARLGIGLLGPGGACGAEGSAGAYRPRLALARKGALGPWHASHDRLRRLASPRCCPPGGGCLVFWGVMGMNGGGLRCRGPPCTLACPCHSVHTPSRSPLRSRGLLSGPAWLLLPSLLLSHRVRVLVGSRLSTCGENHRAGGKRTGQCTVSTWGKSRWRAQGGSVTDLCASYRWMMLERESMRGESSQRRRGGHASPQPKKRAR